jgi:hypothetical protein
MQFLPLLRTGICDLNAVYVEVLLKPPAPNRFSERRSELAVVDVVMFGLIS